MEHYGRRWTTLPGKSNLDRHMYGLLTTMTQLLMRLASIDRKKCYVLTPLARVLDFELNRYSALFKMVWVYFIGE